MTRRSRPFSDAVVLDLSGKGGDVVRMPVPYLPRFATQEGGKMRKLVLAVFCSACALFFLPGGTIACEVVPEGCRVTGGGNDTAGLGIDGVYDGTVAYDKLRLGAGVYNRYTFGGQAGANTALPPQPKGEWTHHQQDGFDGDFVFHGGTASAPPGTEIASIICSDADGPCSSAGLSPLKQIDFDGIGTFRNIRNPSAALQGVVPGETYHKFQVHIEDLGEPGTARSNKNSGGNCPAAGSGTDAFADAFAWADCNCADYYRIRIFEGVTPVFDPATGELANLAEIMGEMELIYQVYGYIDGGNLQIHPLTGFDQ